MSGLGLVITGFRVGHRPLFFLEQSKVQPGIQVMGL